MSGDAEDFDSSLTFSENDSNNSSIRKNKSTYIFSESQQRSQNSLSVLSINVSYFIFGLSIITQILIIGNLALACTTNFNCKSFLPSPGYLGCFRGHDRIFIVACTLYCFILSAFYLALYIQFRSRLSELRRNLLIGLSIISSASLPILGLTNEIIGNHILPISMIYSFSSSTFVISSAIITVIIYNEISNFHVSLKDNEKK